MKNLRIMKFKYFSLLLLGFLPNVCFAYLDPGSGNALIYLLLSLAGTVVYFFKTSFYKIRQFVLGESSIQIKDHNSVPSVVIFSEGKTYWYTFKGIVEELIRRQIPFTYLSIDIEDPGLMIDNPFIHNQFVGEGSAGFARIANCKGDVLLATTPNIGNSGYPLPRPKNIKTMVHISHTVGDLSYLKLGSMDYYDVSMDIADWAGKRVRLVEEKRHLNKKECVSVGLPYLDELAKHVHIKRGNSTPPVILIAPSWGAKNSLKVHGTDFLFDLLHAGYYVILRPHPQSYKFDIELYESLKVKLKQFQNIEFDYSMDSSLSMSKADLLISDSSSFRFDFAFLYKRPVITMLVPSDQLSSYEASVLGGPWETNVVSKLGAVVKSNSNTNICDVVEKLLHEPDLNLDQLYDEIVAFHGQSSSKIVDWLEQKGFCKTIN